MFEGDASDLTRLTKKLRKTRKAVTTEGRERISLSLKVKWQDPEYRERMVKAIKEGMANKKKGQKLAGNADDGQPEPAE